MELIDLILGGIMFANVGLLAVLVPGGPIENRDFSHLGGVVYWGFNTFLSGLILASIAVTYQLLRGEQVAAAGVILSVLYCAVYLLDLGKLFPTSPTTMSKQLMLHEIVNFCVALFTAIIMLSELTA